MVKIILGGIDLECEQDREKGQFLCKHKNKKGEVDAAVLAQVDQEGGMAVIRQRGNTKITDIIKNEMDKGSTIKEVIKKDEGEF